MPRAGPRTVRRYSDQFKLTAVRLSEQPGIQVKTVPRHWPSTPSCSRSGGRKLGGKARKARKAPRPGSAREIARLQALEKEHAILKEEHELLKKAIRFCSARREKSSPSSTRNAARERVGRAVGPSA